MSEQSYYMLDLSALMCYFEIRVNDVEVFAFNVDGQTSTDIPINQGILESGRQEIEVRVLPLQGNNTLHKEAYIRYKVVVFDVSSGDYKYMEQFDNHQTLPVKGEIPVVVHKSNFNAKVPYRIEAWQNGIDLKHADFDIKPKLIEAYEKLSRYIEEGNYTAFIDAMRKREENIATAMYLSENEANQRISRLVDDFQSGFRVAPISDNFIVELSAYGKVATLKRMNGMSALFLENEDTQEELVLQPTFYIPEGKTEFEII